MSLFEWTWPKSGCSHQKLRFDHQDIWLKQHRQNFTKNWFSQKSTPKHHIKLIKFDPMEHEKAGVHAWFWQIEGPRSWSFSWNFWWPLPMYTTHPGPRSQVLFFYQLWLFRIFPYLSYPFLGSVQFSTTMPGHCLNPNLLWSMAQRCSKSDGFHSWKYHPPTNMAVCQNLVPLVNIKIAGKWMFIPPKMVLIGIDPYPHRPWELQCFRQKLSSNPQLMAGSILVGGVALFSLPRMELTMLGQWESWIMRIPNILCSVIPSNR